MIAIIFGKKVFRCHSNHGNQGFSRSQASRHPQGGALLSQGSKACTMMALGSQVSLVTVGQLQFLCFLTVTGIAAAVAEAIAAATVANIIIAL